MTEKITLIEGSTGASDPAELAWAFPDVDAGRGGVGDSPRIDLGRVFLAPVGGGWRLVDLVAAHIVSAADAHETIRARGHDQALGVDVDAALVKADRRL